MEYKQIFTDYKTDHTQPIEHENFARITVFSPETYAFPYLVKFNHGNNHYGDLEEEWSPEPYNAFDHGKIIREAIKRLDEYELQPLKGEG